MFFSFLVLFRIIFKGFISMELKERILDATIRVFNRKGIKFTMDDIAAELSISKKTIYKVIDDKDGLFLDMVDYIFGKVKQSEEEAISRPGMTTLEKIRGILAVMPDQYSEIDFRQLTGVMKRYPAIYEQVKIRLETGWERTIELIEQGKAEGVIRNDIPTPVIKLMYEASLEHFLTGNVLNEIGMSYSKGLETVVEVLMEGIVK